MPKLLNLFITTNRLFKTIKNSIVDKSDPLEMLLLEALITEKSISITLQNHKVYVGIITKLFNPITPLKYINILPILSGYRDPTTKKLYLPLNYQNVYSKIIKDKATISIEDFQIIISVSEIISVNVFDWDIYKEHFTK